MKSTYLLKSIIGLTGIIIMFMGINIGFGGIETLGWQISPDFVSVNNATQYAIQDNHIRFIGGVWFGIGAVFLLGTVAMKQVQTVLVTSCYIIAVAGLFRLSALDPNLILSIAIAPSITLEIIGFPLLAWWINSNSAKSMSIR